MNGIFRSIITSVLAATAVSAPCNAQSVVSDDCSTKGGVAARVNQHDICLDDVDRTAGSDLQATLLVIHDLRAKAAKAIADDYLLEDEAKRRSTTAESLIRQFTAEASPVSEADISLEKLSYPKATLIGGNVSTRYRIARTLELDSRAAALEKYIEVLRKEGEFKLLIPDPGLKLYSRSSHSPSKENGAAGPTTITLFLDYDSRPALSLLRELSEAIRKPENSNANLIVKYFPARLEGAGVEATEISACAGKAGRLEELHHALFAGKDYSSTALIEAADSIGLGERQMKSCINSNATLLQIKQDIVEARLSGVTSVPTVFVGQSPVSDPILGSILARVHAASLNESARNH